MGHQFDFGNVEAGGIIEGLGQGLESASKNLYTIQQNKIKTDMEQQKLDNETDYKHAQIDYLEGRGQLAGAQADSYRFLINRADKQNQHQVEASHDHLDNAAAQVTQQAGIYRNMLNQVLQTPEGQDYVAQKQSGASDATGYESDTTQGPNFGNPVVNNVMPGVGANQQAAPPQRVPVSSSGVASELNKMGGVGGGSASAAGHRNSSLQRVLGKIDAMGIDNQDDAEEMLKSSYGADYAQNPDAVAFLKQKFGGGAASTAGTTTGQGNPAGAPAQGEMVNVTGPDGTPYQLPKVNLQKALSRGYKLRGQ